MARNFAQIHSRIWTDEHFKTRLGVDEQWLYFALLSQPNINAAGILPLQDRRWKKLAKHLTAERLDAALLGLQAHWYVLIDEDTEEVLIRSFIRNDGIWKQPNVLKGALQHAKNTMSETLKVVIWHEVDRLPLEKLGEERAEKTRTLIGTLRPTLTGTLPEGFMEPPADPSEAPSGGPEQENHAPVIPITRSAPENTQVSNVQPTLPPALWDGFAEGFPEGFPKPQGEGAGAGEGAGESLVKELVPKTSSSASADEKPRTSQTLLAEWIGSRQKRPPGDVIGQTSSILKRLLDEDGLDYDDVRNGLIAWDRKRKHPSTIPSFVNEVMDGGPQNFNAPQQPHHDPRYAPGTGSYVDPNAVYTTDPAVVFGTNR